jgi:glycogen debranching enzyme
MVMVTAEGADRGLEDAESEYYIAATTSLSERRPRTLKQGDTFALFDRLGDVPGEPGTPEGLYHRDTRYLSRYTMMLDGRRLMLLGSAVTDNNALLTADLTNPDYRVGDRIVLPRDTVHVVRTKFLAGGCSYERVGIFNFDIKPLQLTLTLRFDCDFADLFEVRGQPRPRRGTRTERVAGPDRVVFSYAGLDGITRETAIVFDPAPAALDSRGARYTLTLAPRERTALFVAVCCGEGAPPPPPKRFFVALRATRTLHRRVVRRSATVETSNQIFNEMLCRSMSDIAMLITDTDRGPYPYAGIPWFSTAFGRDGIITAAQMLWVDSRLAQGVLRFLAATQATEIDPAADAEPGKILHEMRQSEMARLGEVPFRRYYGSVDTTPLFVLLAGLYYRRTGDLATIAALWPSIKLALGWIDEYGDRDGDGLVEYRKQAEAGLDNQGWKDSRDAIFHADGELATGAIALVEVQSYVYAAKRSAAELARLLGDIDLADKLAAAAEALQKRFEEAFWCEEIGFYALALDGDKRPCRVRSSNAGQALISGIAAPERARRVAEQLLGAGFFSGWGIRTIAVGEPRYNPMSYHNGSVWPHDNALIALGLRRYGLREWVKRLMGGLFDAAAYMDQRRLPELFCGFPRSPGVGPTSYPVACSPQAWAAAAPFAVLQACLGLEFDPAARQVRFQHPTLPRFIGEVVIRDLRIGTAHVDVRLQRHGGEVALDVLSRVGDIGVAITL